jgi:copper(I)-binding protein
MKLLNKLAIIVVMALLIVAGCRPETGISIDDAWARPGKVGENSAVYFTLSNTTGAADRVTGAASDAARMVQVHRSIMDADGTMRMEHQEAVDLPAGGEIGFEPGGLHVMLMELVDDLDAGEQITVTLTLEGAGELTFTAAVR